MRTLALPAVSVEVHPPSLNCSAKSPTCMSIGSIVLTVGRFSWLTDAAKPVSTELAAADAAAAAFFEREKESESFAAPASEREPFFMKTSSTAAQTSASPPKRLRLRPNVCGRKRRTSRRINRVVCRPGRHQLAELQ